MAAVLRECGVPEPAWIGLGEIERAPALAPDGPLILVVETVADLARIEPIAPECAFILVSANEELALPAFEMGACDFVLKPIEPRRLRQGLQRAAERRQARNAAVRLAEMQAVIEQLRSRLKAHRAPASESLWVRGPGGGLVRVSASEIVWLESEDDYVRAHTPDRSFLLRGSLRSIAAQLGAHDFVQVHRRALVRADAISAIGRPVGGRLEIVLSSGARVRAGRVYAKGIRAAAAAAARSLSKASAG